MLKINTKNNPLLFERHKGKHDCTYTVSINGCKLGIMNYDINNKKWFYIDNYNHIYWLNSYYKESTNLIYFIINRGE